MKKMLDSPRVRYLTYCIAVSAAYAGQDHQAHTLTTHLIHHPPIPVPDNPAIHQNLATGFRYNSPPPQKQLDPFRN